MAGKFGARRVLLPSMSVAILAFIGVALLPPGSAWTFGLITVASGAALGADMVVLPALFSSKLAQARVPVGVAFGIWSFAAKFSLAVAAGLVLPILQYVGYEPGGQNSETALGALNMLYAVLPCILKLVAMALVVRLKDETL
jgi:Na+/melibiose symporter-like transporter